MKKVIYEGNNLTVMDGKFALAWHNEKLEVIQVFWAYLDGKNVRAKWRYETGKDKGVTKESFILVSGVKVYDTLREALQYRKDWRSPFQVLPACAVKERAKK